MDVVFRDVGQFEVDHVGQLINVQAAGGDIGSYQNAQGVGLEVGQCLGACALALVAMNRRRRQTVLDQVLGQTVGSVFGAGKDQHLFPGALGDQMGDQRTLVAGSNAVDLLIDALDGGIRRRDFDTRRVVEQLVGQIGDVFREGRGEQQVLTLGRQFGDDLLHVMDKAHVEHAVGFVQHQYLYLRQIDSLLTDQVKKAARAGNQNIEAGSDGFHLRVGANATKDAGGLEWQLGSIGANAVVHLSCQLTGRGKYQHANLFGARALAGGLASGE